MSSKQSFPPVVDTHTHTLILGSLPGDKSLLQQQYYAHPQNKFWKLVGDSIGVELATLDYPARLSTLLVHQIGLWDVIANARRRGSLDSDIREHTHNDLPALIDTLPELKTIAFNGGTAARIGMKTLGERARDFRILLLPSSSSAYATLSFAQKLDMWQQLTTTGNSC
ncbi:hypoxanthine-DNA glycosylase [Herbaspirillum sp. Sphag1AN]|uniref:DNA-deoxyinosine glycosylase n=1 Tax=unclassified Herbaspirillum TaxID=2624150 RepID=UPI00161C636C|nr:MULTISPECIES: DNA-deoxyinosine glycosylase [unclassified Herbaspirillum]MBB3211681.1 hypoxanthine-DNA glycosylase [Herbaspirillum sp. Sphag1AN]MBB3245051.1 hypoxanthine-DNA glycosylase [Herbaspirillum sp. Sphag64]